MLGMEEFEIKTEWWALWNDEWATVKMTRFCSNYLGDAAMQQIESHFINPVD